MGVSTRTCLGVVDILTDTCLSPVSDLCDVSQSYVCSDSDSASSLNQIQFARRSQYLS